MATTATTAKKTYRQFQTSTSAEQFIIREIGTTTRHPMNWCGETTREGAWAAATAQSVREIAVLATGQPVRTYNATEVFNPANFERAAYSGYVGYGLSMTDGYYAPISSEAWIRAFRKEVLESADLDAKKIFYGNDASALVKASLPAYAARLRTATAKK
jgi:hypothetical protein